MFSKACEYGIRATILIAQASKQGQRTSLKEIARKIDSPVAFTAKILQSLAKEDVIRSVKGSHGGYEIDKTGLEQVTLCDIVSAIDGDRIYKGCGLGFNTCNAKKPCPVHDHFVAIRDNLKAMLEQTTIEKLTIGLDEGMTFLKR